MTDELLMKRCFSLAENGLGNTAPNPLVGSVIVYQDKIIAEGFHTRYGGPHAEIEALTRIKDYSVLKDSILYVNLEPCSHYGKTPPCAHAIIQSGIRKVVISNTDCNPAVSGNGIRILKEAGIEVVTGLLAKEGHFINRRFFTFHEKKRPYIILKWAESRDGFISPAPDVHRSGKPFWISSESSRLLVHKWRAEEQAILVGKNTVINDNPELTCRHFSGNNPIRIVIDPNQNLLREKYKIFNGAAETIHFCKMNEHENEKQMLVRLFGILASKEVQSLIVEGGRFTLGTFIKNGFWDEARVFQGTTILQAGITAPSLKTTSHHEYLIENDKLSFHYKNRARND